MYIKYIDVMQVINLQMYLLFWLLGPRRQGALKRGSQCLHFSATHCCLKQDDFKISHRDERKDVQDYIKVSLV